MYERPSALPRAWWVHSAQLVSQSTALRPSGALAAQAFDPHRIALLETDWPPRLEPPDVEADRVTVVSSRADAIELRASSSAAGLVVLSESFYPAWHASVDGQPVRVYVADGALQAVPVPAGDHSIQMRFESTALSVGLIISVAASAALLVLAARILVRNYRAR